MVNIESLGFSIIYDFVTEDEEKDILSQLQQTPKQPYNSARNYVRRYGSSVPYATPAVSSAEIPKFLDDISTRLLEKGLLDERPDSITVNEYLDGQSIDWHIDSPASGPVITVLSLGGHAAMGFKTDKETAGIKVPPRCLTQLRDDIRHKWAHNVAAIKARRYSIVFRCSTKS